VVRITGERAHEQHNGTDYYPGRHGTVRTMVHQRDDDEQDANRVVGERVEPRRQELHERHGCPPDEIRRDLPCCPRVRTSSHARMTPHDIFTSLSRARRGIRIRSDTRRMTADRFASIRVRARRAQEWDDGPARRWGPPPSWAGGSPAMRRTLSLVVAGVLAIAVIATIVVAVSGGGGSDNGPQHLTVVRGVIGSEKKPFFSDRRVRAAFADA